MIILILLMLFIIIFFIVTSVKLLSDVKDIKNQISFEEFKNFYSLEPEHWTLEDHYVKFHKDKHDHWRYTEFRFNLIDTWKYSWFVAGEEVKEEMEKKNKEKSAANNAYNQMKEVMSKYKEET